jgi:ATP phosphoribosyltransferase
MHRLLGPARAAGCAAALGYAGAKAPASDCFFGDRKETNTASTTGLKRRNSMPGRTVPPPNLLFGVPKKGRLHEKIKELLNGAGIEYTRKARLDIAHCTELPVSLGFLPAADIATYVGEGDVDMGITGEDIVAESEVEVAELMKLGMGRCRLCVQAPAGAYASADGLAGKRVVTSFPNLSRKYFASRENGAPTKIKCISGSVEAACGLGLADGIVDLVETGTTMRAAGLAEVATIMETETVLIANPHSAHGATIEQLRKRIAGYLTASRYYMVTYNVRRADLPAAKEITPGKKSPSIAPLENGDWVAVSALVQKKKAAQKMDDLEAIGATDILLTALHSSRMGD